MGVSQPLVLPQLTSCTGFSSSQLQYLQSQLSDGTAIQDMRLQNNPMMNQNQHMELLNHPMELLKLRSLLMEPPSPLSTLLHPTPRLGTTSTSALLWSPSW